MSSPIECTLKVLVGEVSHEIIVSIDADEAKEALAMFQLQVFSVADIAPEEQVLAVGAVSGGDNAALTALTGKTLVDNEVFLDLVRTVAASAGAIVVAIKVSRAHPAGSEAKSPMAAAPFTQTSATAAPSAAKPAAAAAAPPKQPAAAIRLPDPTSSCTKTWFGLTPVSQPVVQAGAGILCMACAGTCAQFSPARDKLRPLAISVPVVCGCGCRGDDEVAPAAPTARPTLIAPVRGQLDAARTLSPSLQRLALLSSASAPGHVLDLKTHFTPYQCALLLQEGAALPAEFPPIAPVKGECLFSQVWASSLSSAASQLLDAASRARLAEQLRQSALAGVRALSAEHAAAQQMVSTIEQYSKDVCDYERADWQAAARAKVPLAMLEQRARDKINEAKAAEAAEAKAAVDAAAAAAAVAAAAAAAAAAPAAASESSSPAASEGCGSSDVVGSGSAGGLAGAEAKSPPSPAASASLCSLSSAPATPDAAPARTSAAAASNSAPPLCSAPGYSARAGGQVTEAVFRDYLLREVLNWFKHDFFKWTNCPPCGGCGAEGGARAGHAPPTPEEAKYGAGRVELYQCPRAGAGCPSPIIRFPRYNSAVKLLETRHGRCGEWAQAFTLVCRALGYEARVAHDWTDHVWTEVRSEALDRWVHCDSCENQWDCPLTYEGGWGKKLNFIISSSCDDVVDVTRRYTRMFYGDVGRRRNEAGIVELWLRDAVAALAVKQFAAHHSAQMSKGGAATAATAWRKLELLRRQLRERMELQRCNPHPYFPLLPLDAPAAAPLPAAAPAAAAAAAAGAQGPRELKPEEMQGRQTGSLEWRRERGELGEGGGHEGEGDKGSGSG